MYLKAVEAEAPSAILELRIIDEPSTSPKQLVEAACSIRRAAEKARRRTGDPNEDVDQVWCVFDVDSHHMIKEACKQAQDNDVLLAVSNPCIELWFLLHFQDQTAFIERDQALSKLKNHLPHYDKRIEAIDVLRDRYAAARSRARALDLKHTGDSTVFPDNNPSSTMHRLIDALGVDY